jgi:hypothetical protein
MKNLNRIWLVTAYLFISLNNFSWAVDPSFYNKMPEEHKILTFIIPESWHGDLPKNMHKLCHDHECKKEKGYSGEFIAEKFFHYIFNKDSYIISHKSGKYHEGDNTKKHGFDELYRWYEGQGGKAYYLVNESKTANDGFKLTPDSLQQSLFWNRKTISEKYGDYSYMQDIKKNFIEKLNKGDVVRTATYLYYNKKEKQYLMDLYWLHTGSNSNIYEQEIAASKLVFSDLISKISDGKIDEIHLSKYMQKKFDLP